MLVGAADGGVDRDVPVDHPVGVGVGANALFGGSNSTISLQPLSVQGQTGLSAAAGVAGMDLEPAHLPPRARKHRRHH